MTMIQGKGYFNKEQTKNLKRFLSQAEIRNVSSTSKRGKMMLILHYLKVSLCCDFSKSHFKILGTLTDLSSFLANDLLSYIHKTTGGLKNNIAPSSKKTKKIFSSCLLCPLIIIIICLFLKRLQYQ